MKLCNEKNCAPLCDFCKFYDFNGNKDGAYTGNGYCNKHDKKRDPEDECDEFECDLIEDKIKLKKYKCPTCNEEDTILFCCECMRKITDEKIKRLKKPFFDGMLFECKSIREIIDKIFGEIIFK